MGRVQGWGRFGVNFRSSVCDLLRWSCSLAIQMEMLQRHWLDKSGVWERSPGWVQGPAI